MNFSDLYEGPEDPGIFKAIFLAGGPGSGKSFAAKQLGLESYGLKSVNSDEAFEYLLHKNDVDTTPAGIASDKGQELRKQAKKLTDLKKQGFLAGRLGVVIDGTAKDPNKILSMKASLEELGYQTAMIFVSTSLRTAMERNLKRARSIPTSLLAKSHKQVQEALPALKAEFGANYFEIQSDNPIKFNDSIAEADKGIKSFVSGDLTSTAKKWVNAARLSKVAESDLKFAHDSDVDIPREQMPQINIKHLKKNDYRIVKGRIELNKIKPSQSQRVPGLTQSVIDDMYSGKMKKKPLVVDKYGYLVNGHHRLDALKHLGAEKTDVLMVDATLQDLIKDFEHTASDAFAEEVDENFADGKVKGKSIDEGPKDFADMKLDQKAKQDSIDYFYHEHAPTFGKPTKAGSFKGHSIVTFKTPDGTLMFFVNKNDQAVFYVGLDNMPDGAAIGNVRSNGTIKATEIYRYLVSKYGKLYSDKHQTPDGRKIWANLAKYNPELKISDAGDRLMATENFADGKVKGKSRPGRVKKAGASCKGSVSSLRAKAKKYSGEKGKMYHWCANMKSGKKK